MNVCFYCSVGGLSEKFEFCVVKQWKMANGRYLLECGCYVFAFFTCQYLYVHNVFNTCMYCLVFQSLTCPFGSIKNTSPSFSNLYFMVYIVSSSSSPLSWLLFLRVFLGLCYFYN
ncbi:hypothetical protein Csa_012646 [Cucumis sativus]|uniref:Uncharacterized protein n=1 Tax=Cucumis sativus TaxID=3659 RepID=A0A0A0KZY2_CUCSA|nr:hypothetical protein Csa_012646 [Cucumis sativus]